MSEQPVLIHVQNFDGPLDLLLHLIKSASIDIYDLLLYGKTFDNIRLQDGDVVIVPPYKSLVNVSGRIKRPMYYEMIQGETASTLIQYAGGFVGGAYTDKITLSRKTGG